MSVHRSRMVRPYVDGRASRRMLRAHTGRFRFPRRALHHVGVRHRRQGISSDNLWIGGICVVVIVVAVRSPGLNKQRGRKVGVYLAGVGRDNENRMFQNAMSGSSEATVRNWYMTDIFGEAPVTPVGVWFNIIIMAAAFAFAIVGTPMVF